MKTTALLTLLMAGSLAAQQPQPQQPPQPEQPPPPGMGRQGPEVERLRAEVEDRFGRMVQSELQLNDQQMERVRTAMRANQDRRRDLMRREMDLRRAVQRQMQPGVQANNDSLNRAMDQISRLQVERAQSDQQMLRDLDFLQPVQKARFIMMTQRFETRMREIREQRERVGERRQAPDQPRMPRRPRGGRM